MKESPANRGAFFVSGVFAVVPIVVPFWYPARLLGIRAQQSIPLLDLLGVASQARKSFAHDDDPAL
jgi:hypothetical protein